MCRNIRTLFNFAPPATEEEMRSAALQYVRKLAGATRPSAANQAVFDEAVEEVFAATERLIHGLTTKAPARTREEEAVKAKARYEKRFGPRTRPPLVDASSMEEA